MDQAALNGKRDKVRDGRLVDGATLVGRVVETENPALIAAYKERLTESERTKAELKEQLAKCGKQLGSFDDGFRTAMAFLANPSKLWVSGRLDLKHLG